MQGKRVSEGAGRDGKADLARRGVEARIDGEREGRDAELRRIEAKRKVMHDRIAGERRLDDVAERNARRFRRLRRKRRERLVHGLGELAIAARMHHDVGDAAHQILAEPDLRVHAAARGEDIAASEIAEMGRDRRRADVEGKAEDALLQAGIDGDDVAPVPQASRHGEIAGAQRFLQAAQHGEPGAHIREAPLLRERLREAAEIARRIGHVGSLDLDVMEAQHRVDLHRPGLGALAHHLPVQLRFRRHVDEEIAAKARLATEPLAPPEATAQACVALLDGAGGRHMVERGGNAALLVHAFDDGDPATSADAAPAAHRIEIDAELACRLEHAHPFGKAPALAGGREGDGEFGHAFDLPITPWPGLARPPTPLPREKEDADGRDDPRNESEHGHDAMHGRASSWWRLLPAAGLDERAQATFVIVALDTLDLCEDGGFEILPAGQGLALSPIGEIGVGAGRAASHRGHVDRLREARRQLALDAPAPARAGRRCGDLSWNIAPIGDAELCHRAYREGCWGAMAAGGAGVCRARKPSRPVKPVTRFSNGRPSKPAAASALLSRSASGAWASQTTLA